MNAIDVDIHDYLLKIGHKPVSQTGNYTKYFSPFRNEGDASFLVRNTDQKWSDPGHSPIHLDSRRKEYKWHGVLDLAMEVNGCDARTAANILLNASSKKANKIPITEVKPSIEIISVETLRKRYLVNYLKSRNINIDIARKYCKQVEVKFEKHPDKTFLYIGFENNKGGWDLRNERIKISSSPKYFTKINGNGNTKNINVFEGFSDYLSALTYYRRDTFKNTTFVLNSLVNVAYITGYLDRSERNYMFLDNDQAADDKMDWLMKEGLMVDDMRGTYAGYNDFNDFICGKPML